MDQALVRFRQAAARENRGRRDVRRRYSPMLREQAVAYWRNRRQHGERFRDVAAALGVAAWSLHRWTRASKTRVRFRPVTVAAAPPAVASPLVVVMGATGPRVEGLDVESAARLLALLR
jgi:transposase-like protein